MSLSARLGTTDWSQDFKIWTKMHLSTAKVPIDFDIDLDLQFLFF